MRQENGASLRALIYRTKMQAVRHRQDQSLNWAILAFSLITATVVPIGIHTIMLDQLGVPYPAAFPHSGWAPLPDHALRVFALFGVYAALHDDKRWNLLTRVIFIALAVAALNEDLFRLPIMRNAVSTRWTIYPFVDNLPQILQYVVLTIMVAALARRVMSQISRVAAAVIIASTLDFVVSPILATAFNPIIAFDAAREGDQLYNVPYDWHVDLPSYMTFAEPAIAALLLAAWLGRDKATIAVGATIFALRAGPLFGVALYPFFAPIGIALAWASKGQFALESAALAFIAAIGMRASVRTL